VNFPRRFLCYPDSTADVQMSFPRIRFVQDVQNRLRRPSISTTCSSPRAWQEHVPSTISFTINTGVIIDRREYVREEIKFLMNYKNYNMVLNSKKTPGSIPHRYSDISS